MALIFPQNSIALDLKTFHDNYFCKDKMASVRTDAAVDEITAGI